MPKNMASPSYYYGVVIDAGSSGSRIHTYRWSDTEGGPLVEREAVFYDERDVGLGAEGGLEALSDLIAAAAAALPSDATPGGVPVYLGATAGVRLSSAAADIVEDARALLRASGLRFQDEWARTITGDEESVYGWLVANYLREGRLPHGDGRSASTYGAMDLGGGSTQISCLVPSAATGDDDAFPLRIGREEYRLYTRSYLHFGADQARDRHDAHIIGEQMNPCYPTGYIHPDNTIAGSSNWDECFDSVAKLFDQRSNLRGGANQAVLDVITPPPNFDAQQQRYIAMSVFVFVWDFLGLETGPRTQDLNALREKAGQICRMTREQQAAQYDKTMEGRPPARKTNKAFAQCFNAAYAHHLLVRGYGLPAADTPVEVYYEINGGKVNWALGLMLVEAGNLERRHGAGSLGGRRQQRGGSSYFDNSAVRFSTVLFTSLILLLGVLFGRFRRAETVKSLFCHRMSKNKQ